MKLFVLTIVTEVVAFRTNVFGGRVYWGESVDNEESSPKLFQRRELGKWSFFDKRLGQLELITQLARALGSSSAACCLVLLSNQVSRLQASSREGKNPR